MNSVVSFRYHSNAEKGKFIQHPDPYHLGGVNGATDFGAGFYLSDDLYGTYIWGARHEYPASGTLNVYNIDSRILSLDHLILTDAYEDILYWAMTTGSYLGYYPRNIASAHVGQLEEHYMLDADDYHWILSRRTDDRMFTYLGAFFDGSLSFRGLVECYDNLAFGDELVLKTQEAINCLSFDEEQSGIFDKSSYIGQYESLKTASNEHFNVIFEKHACSYSGEPGVADIIKWIENGQDWTQYV